MKLVRKQRECASRYQTQPSIKKANKYELRLKFPTVAFQTTLRYVDAVHLNDII